MRARYMETRSRDVTVPVASAACNSGIVASISRNEDRVWAFAHVDPATANVRRHAKTGVLRGLLMRFSLGEMLHEGRPPGDTVVPASLAAILHGRLSSIHATGKR